MAVIDLLNQRFGKLVVVERDLTRTGGAAYWKCKCDCGGEKTTRGQSLRDGSVTDCGCEGKKARRAKIDTTSLVGQTFGKLTVLERDLTKPIGHGCDSYWICQCECGNTTVVRRQELTGGKTKSCGCFRSQQCIEKNTLDLTNKRYGHLVAVENTYELTSHHSYLWKCICDCGNICYIPAEVLTQEKTTSCGCKRVKSRGEEKIYQLLTEANIAFNREQTFSDCRNPKTNKLFRYDFALLDENNQVSRLIEFDGEQHFRDAGWKFDLEAIQANDQFKNNYAKEHDIPLIRIPYYDLKQLTLEDLLGNKYLQYQL